MMRLRNFEDFNNRKIELAIIKYLHEGIKMIPLKPINESALTDHADFEIDLAIKRAKTEGNSLIISEFIPEIKSLIKKFAQSGQSGGSAPYTSGAIIDTLKKLMSFEPLNGVENLDSEWNDCIDMGGDNIFQNNRLFSVFKNGKEGRPYYLDAIIFKGQNDITFTGNSVEVGDGSKVGSANYIKKFPFKPKSFIIDVEETEWANKEEKVKQKGGGWWTSVVKDPSQLDEVWEYYDKLERE